MSNGLASAFPLQIFGKEGKARRHPLNPARRGPWTLFPEPLSWLCTRKHMGVSGHYTSFFSSPERDDRSNTGVQRRTMKSVIPTSDCGLGFDLMSSRGIPLYQRPVLPSSTRHPAGGPLLAKYLHLPSRKAVITVPNFFLENEMEGSRMRFEAYCGKKWRNILHSLIGTLSFTDQMSR